MRSQRTRREPSLIRPLPALLALGAGAALSVAVAAASSTQIGETTPAPVGPSDSAIVAVSTVAGTLSYTTPEGVLTRWRFHSANEVDPGRVKLKIFRPTGAPREFKAVADSSLETLASNTGYEFQAHIPVKQGDVLGVYGEDDDLMDGPKTRITTPGASDNAIGMFTGDVPTGSTRTHTSPVAGIPEYRVSVAATVESDADGDGFGDDTEDACPDDASRRELPCPAKPGTAKPGTDNRRPKLTLSAAKTQNVIANRSASVTITSDESGAVTAAGTLSVPGASKSYKLISTSKAIKAGVKTTLRVGVSRKARRKAKRALRRGRKVRARLRVTVQDAAKNKTSKTTTVKVKRPR